MLFKNCLKSVKINHKDDGTIEVASECISWISKTVYIYSSVTTTSRLSTIYFPTTNIIWGQFEINTYAINLTTYYSRHVEPNWTLKSILALNLRCNLSHGVYISVLVVSSIPLHFDWLNDLLEEMTFSESYSLFKRNMRNQAL